jgi:hypothetical protein
MSFEELLRASLEGVNARFTVAEDDLIREAAEAAQGVERLTDGKATLTLQRIDETPKGVFYGLLLGPRGAGREIMAFRLHPAGYPIMVAGNSADIPERSWRQIDDRSKLSGLFSELASAPGSPVVVGVAYLLRRKSRKGESDGEGGAAGAGNPHESGKA